MNLKERYAFSSWPENSFVDEDEPPVNFRLDKYDTGYKLIKRNAIPYPKSYEDIYQSEDDENVFITIKVINSNSFDEAKERLMSYLSRCSLFLEQITEQLESYSADIAFSAPGDLGSSIAVVRGRALIIMGITGLRSTDLIPLYGVVNEKINLLKQSRRS